MSKSEEQGFHFEGEETGAGFASPTLDLIAAAALVVLSVVVMRASLALPVPGEIQTAPGLLPFIVAASLLVMALGLGASAVTRMRTGPRIPAWVDRDLATDLRSLVLAVIVAVYISALQFLAFQQNFTGLGVNFRLTAFEPVTIIALVTIIHLYWRGPIWIAACISVVWTLALSLIFQIVFRIPLPGTF